MYYYNSGVHYCESSLWVLVTFQEEGPLIPCSSHDDMTRRIPGCNTCYMTDYNIILTRFILFYPAMILQSLMAS